MAKKKSESANGDRVNKRIRARDKATLGKIVNLADNIESAAFKGRDIAVAIPTRTRSNTLWNKKRGILQMGDPQHHRAGCNPIQEVRSKVCPARRKGHGLGALQRGSILGETQLHLDGRKRPAAARRPTTFAPPQ